MGRLSGVVNSFVHKCLRKCSDICVLCNFFCSTVFSFIKLTFVKVVSGLQVGEMVLLSLPQGIEREPASETKQPKQQSPEDEQPKDSTEEGGESLEQPIPDTKTTLSLSMPVSGSTLLTLFSTACPPQPAHHFTGPLSLKSSFVLNVTGSKFCAMVSI